MTIHRDDLDNMDFSDVADLSAPKIPPTHPGEILLEDFLKPAGVSQYRLAKAMGVPALRLSQIIRGKRAVTADTALRLAKVLGTTAQFWLTIQNRYDLESAESTIQELAHIEPLRAA